MTIPAAAPPAAQTQQPVTPEVSENAAAPEAEVFAPDALLTMARDEFNAGRIASAISLLDRFTEIFPSGSDEAWWLYGQCFEANSPSRNILAALEYYRRLIREYPQSGRSTEARRRISILERHFINIR